MLNLSYKIDVLSLIYVSNIFPHPYVVELYGQSNPQASITIKMNVCYSHLSIMYIYEKSMIKKSSQTLAFVPTVETILLIITRFFQAITPTNLASLLTDCYGRYNNLYKLLWHYICVFYNFKFIYIILIECLN